MWILKVFGVVLAILQFVSLANCWFESCSVERSLAAGGLLTLSSPNNGNYRYRTGTSCLYRVTVPLDYAIQATCTMRIDQSTNCASQKFYISRDGQKNLAGAEFKCGIGSMVRTTVSNELYFGYTSMNDGRAGNFSCTMTTINIGPTSGNCDCGWSFNTKIVGGTTAPVNQFTSNVGLINTQSRSIFCHGAIISYRHILSVAHCFVSNSVVANIAALVGDHDITVGSDTPFAAVYKIASIIIHKDYRANSELNNYDIAMLRTVDYIRFNRAVGPVCLPYKFQSSNSLVENKQVSVVGWGSVFFGEPPSDILKLVTLNTITNTVCSQKMSNINAMKICTYTPGKDTCQFDSGANLYYYSLRQYTVGLTSYGVACASSNPSVSTRVTSFIPWIEQNSGVRFCNK